MVTYASTMHRAIVAPPDDQRLSDVRSEWAIGYRRDHPEADWWAEGVWTINHSFETQERVFRMAEQLAARGIDRAVTFAALRHADMIVDAAGRGIPADIHAQHLYVDGRGTRREDSGPDPWSTGRAVADAGCAVIERLIAENTTVVSVLRPEAFENDLTREGRDRFPQGQAGRVMIVIDREPRIDHLRAYGFDPVIFDGADPAAFAWAVFELSSRVEAAAAELQCHCHAVFRPVPLGIAVKHVSRSLASMPSRYSQLVITALPPAKGLGEEVHSLGPDSVSDPGDGEAISDGQTQSNRAG